MSDNGLIGPNFCPECGGEYGEHARDCSRGDGAPTLMRDDATLRDYFAAKAMQASITNDAALRATFAAAKGTPKEGAFALALTAYAYADAMLKAREEVA